ncbi:MAG TPA: DUF6471 domain-containing protein [Gammaproteobacteria bacterium]|nr:DUF6471 domain-containing protein [Gammaproteobacteria bacterium]
MPNKKTFWAKAASNLLRVELAKRGMSYGDLKIKLANIGVVESEANIKNKFSRGTFSTIFFLQCLRALEVKKLELDETIFTDAKAAK